MTTIDLYRKHKAGEVSREKFLYEVRRDNNLPFITNLTSYDDAVRILKNRGIINEGPTKEAKADEAVKAEVKPKKSSEKKPSILHIDQANPYEYRHGLQHELCELDDYSDEALEKAKDKVLKNLAKDANYYSNLLNQKQSPFEFKKSETDAKGMQAKADGHLKKELKKNEKSNIQDTLGKKEAGKKKPKGTKEMTQTPKKVKGVKVMDMPGKEKVIKEGIEGKFDNEDNIYTYDHLINTDIPVGKDLKTVLLAIKKDQEELNKQGKKTKVVKGDTVPYLELKEANPNYQPSIGSTAYNAKDTITTKVDMTATNADDSSIKINIPAGTKVKVIHQRMEFEPKTTQLQIVDTGDLVNVNAEYFLTHHTNARTGEFRESKITKLKEILKKKIKEGKVEDDIAKNSAIKKEQAVIAALTKQKQELLADPNKPIPIKNKERDEIELKLRSARENLTKIQQGKIKVV